MKSGDFYNRVFTSNRVLNTTTVQPVIRPAKIENGEEIKIYQNEKKVDNKLEEKYELLEKEFSELKERIEFLENKINEKNIIEFEPQEFDTIIEE